MDPLGLDSYGGKRPALRREPDYSLLAAHWDLFEGSGLAENVVNLLPYIGNNVLLIGSGQGIVAEQLAHHGRAVICLDRSQEMAGWAMRRRGIQTVVCDIRAAVPGGLFDAVIISTGVLSGGSQSIAEMEPIVTAASKFVAKRGSLLISYFLDDGSLRWKRELGLGYDSRPLEAIIDGAGDWVDTAYRLSALGLGSWPDLHRILSENAQELNAIRLRLEELLARFPRLARQDRLTLLDQLNFERTEFDASTQQRLIATPYALGFTAQAIFEPRPTVRCLICQRPV